MREYILKNGKRYRKLGPRGALLCTERTIKLKDSEKLPPTDKSGKLWQRMTTGGSANG